MLQPSKYDFLRDPSLWFLVGANAITIYFALTEGWNLGTIMWIYWIQSVMIGVFNFIRIVQLEKFTTDGIKVNGVAINANTPQAQSWTKGFFAVFFLMHYGMFHFVYLIFLIVGSFIPEFGSSAPEWKEVGLVSALFFINHLFSFLFNQQRDSHEQNIGTVMMYPYARIIPMHLTIIFGAFINALPLFLILKAGADAVMHIMEHALLRKGTKNSPVVR